MPKTLQEIIDHADELASAAYDYTPGPAETGLPAEPWSRLYRAVRERARAEAETTAAVVGMRRAGYPWSRIGPLLGTTGEAARVRYSDAAAHLESEVPKNPEVHEDYLDAVLASAHGVRLLRIGMTPQLIAVLGQRDVLVALIKGLNVPPVSSPEMREKRKQALRALRAISDQLDEHPDHELIELILAVAQVEQKEPTQPAELITGVAAEGTSAQ